MKNILGIVALTLGLLALAAPVNAGLVELRFDDTAGSGGPANPGSVLDLVENFDGNTGSTGLFFSGVPHAPSGHDTIVQCGVADRGGDCSVNQDGEGLGVTRHPNDNSDVDNYLGDEYLAFQFNQTLTLLGIDFEKVDYFDHAVLAIVGEFEIGDFVYPGDESGRIVDFGICDQQPSYFEPGQTVDDGNGPPSDGLECQVVLQPFVVNNGEWLLIGTRSPGHHDDFRIESLWVDKAVPEPTTLLLLGAGLLGIRFRRNRR